MPVGLQLNGPDVFGVRGDPSYIVVVKVGAIESRPHARENQHRQRNAVPRTLTRRHFSVVGDQRTHPFGIVATHCCALHTLLLQQQLLLMLFACRSNSTGTRCDLTSGLSSSLYGN